MIDLIHRTQGGRASGVWEFDPARRAVDAVIQTNAGEIAMTIPVCAAHLADSPIFRGYPIAPTSPEGLDWVIAATSRFHALLPRTPLLLRCAPAEIAAELRAL